MHKTLNKEITNEKKNFFRKDDDKYRASDKF